MIKCAFALTITLLAACEPDPTEDCCAVCETGEPCGDACIESTDVCSEGAGCACDSEGNPGVAFVELAPTCISGNQPLVEGGFCCGEINVAIVNGGSQTITTCR